MTFKEYLTEKLQAMNCIPVFLDDAIGIFLLLSSSQSSICMHSSCIIIINITIIVDLAYYGYCKKILWPLFHNVDQLDQIHAAWNLHPEDYVTVDTSSGECV